jgi:hypothetical protein
MTELVAHRAGTVRIAFAFTGSRLLAALGGGRDGCFASG